MTMKARNAMTLADTNHSAGLTEELLKGSESLLEWFVSKGPPAVVSWYRESSKSNVIYKTQWAKSSEAVGAALFRAKALPAALPGLEGYARNEGDDGDGVCDIPCYARYEQYYFVLIVYLRAVIAVPNLCYFANAQRT